MKKVIAGLMMSVTVLGLATATTGAFSVHAATTDPAPAPAATITATDGKASTSNKATLTVEGGDLSFTQPKDVELGKANVGTVFASGYDSKAVDGGTTTVSDFLGDNGTWKLNVSASGFGNAALDADGATTLALTATGTGSTGKAITLGTDEAQAVTGGAGQTNAALAYQLNIKAGTLLTKGTYINTVNWNLANTPGANQN